MLPKKPTKTTTPIKGQKPNPFVKTAPLPNKGNLLADSLKKRLGR